MSSAIYAGGNTVQPSAGIDSVNSVNAYLKSLINTEEPYVNDIPFNTESIATFYNYCQATCHPGDEAFVDDIPFNTRKIAKKYLRHNSLNAFMR